MIVFGLAMTAVGILIGYLLGRDAGFSSALRKLARIHPEPKVVADGLVVWEGWRPPSQLELEAYAARIRAES